MQLAITALASGAATVSGNTHESASELAFNGSQLQTPRHGSGADGASGIDLLRERLREAATTGQGVAEMLTAAEPATAAEALRELRSEHVPAHSTPVLRLVARAADGQVERVLARGSAGEVLPADLAARLGPYVGPEVAGAARLHTDEAADLVAASHHARALTLGGDIYFARGEYAPGTERGDELLAHELTHVAQGQRGELTRAAAKGIDSGGVLGDSLPDIQVERRLLRDSLRERCRRTQQPIWPESLARAPRRHVCESWEFS